VENPLLAELFGERAIDSNKELENIIKLCHAGYRTTTNWVRHRQCIMHVMCIHVYSVLKPFYSYTYPIHNYSIYYYSSIHY